MKISLRTIVVVMLAFTFLITILIFPFAFYTNGNANDEINATYVDFVGEYVADDEVTEKISSIEEFTNDGYENVVFTGKLTENIPKDKYLIMSVCDVWVEVYQNGELLASNTYDTKGKTDTPGISFVYINGKDILDDTEFTFSFRNPYFVQQDMDPIYDTMSMLCYGEKDVPYAVLLKEQTLSITLSLAICFLGLFAFTLAGVLYKKVLMKNLTLALLAIIGGIYVLTDSVCPFLPLWVNDQLLCMMIDEFTTYLLPIAAFLYMRQYIKVKRDQIYLNILVIGSCVVAITGYVMQCVGFADLLYSQDILMIFTDLGVIGSTVALFYEAFFVKDSDSKKFLVSVTPLILASMFDTVNAWLYFAPGKSMIRIGFLLSIGAQIYFLIIETIQHNKEMAQIQKMEYDLLQMRISIMASQIQPHFLYNSLTSIAQLCEKNPQQAKKATIEFADYMRHNMNSIKDSKPVPFDTELTHLKTYLSLEKMRFGDDLEIVFDIETTDFVIPSLAVQPLVENAVKHGVGMKEDGGTVRISTREYDDRYEIVVSDDGVGFDTTKKPDDGRTHVGMENVKTRLQTMCNAEVVITSEINKGTVSKIIIPKEDEK